MFSSVEPPSVAPPLARTHWSALRTARDGALHHKHLMLPRVVKYGES